MLQFHILIPEIKYHVPEKYKNDLLVCENFLTWFEKNIMLVVKGEIVWRSIWFSEGGLQLP